MLELGFPERSFMQSTTRPRHRSPDSVIPAIESNFSLFSSTSASADRSSITSDAHEHDSIVFKVSQHLAECELSSLPYPGQSKLSTVRHISRPLTKSYNLEECPEKRSRSEAILHRQRPFSLDMNNVAISSPRLGGMKQASISSKATCVFPSPGTPHYRYNNPVIQKGWSSERVSSHAISNRRRITTTILPYNNGRTLPSKWEDAERWILSPGSVDRGTQPSLDSLPPPQRRPKSKSGPLGPPGVACYSLCSPLVPIPNRGNGGSAVATSSFPAGVVDGASGCSVGIFLSQPEPCMIRSASVSMCSELLCLPHVPPTEVNGAANNGSNAVSRRDMATQMSPDGSQDSSPRVRPLFSSSALSGLPVFENGPSSGSEIRDVQVAECVKMIRWSKKNKSRNSVMESANGWIKYAASTESAELDSIQTAKCTAKAEREEAKIAAWENLQKAKAEEAIRKLEVKLEKKRSSSMEKIMKKLRSAQKRAQGMRNSVLASRASSVSVRSVLSNSISRSSISSTRQVGSLGSCFTCRGR